MTDHDHDAVLALRQAADQHRYRGTVDVADVVRSGARRRREQARHRTVVAAALTTAGVVAGVMVSVGVAVGPGRQAIGPSGPQEPVAVLALLARPPVADDEIPAVNESVAAEEEPYDMVRDSTRLVAEADGVGYYAGISPRGEVCVLVHLQAQSQVASSCAPPERFDEVGVWVNASNYSGTDVTGLLLPDRLREPAPADLPDILERAGTGAQEEATLPAPNLVTVVSQQG